MAFRYALAGLIAVAVALPAGAPFAASAQCRLCDKPTTEFQLPGGDAPLRLDIETTLDFDRLVLVGAGEGAASLLPNGDRSVTGTVATVSAGAMLGSVVVRGQAGRAVRIHLPKRIDLVSGSGARIAIDRLETDLPSLPKLDSAGNLSFRFGGRVEIRGDAEGDYRGDIPISVDYL